ncbi:MAG: C40 family peptidase [Firmicutes bacterium]|nr:C40 family peptidase [Bacillota bacterium]
MKSLKVYRKPLTVATLLACCTFPTLTGCSNGTPSAAAPTVKTVQTKLVQGQLYHVTNTSYNAASKTVNVYAEANPLGRGVGSVIPSTKTDNTIDVRAPQGIVNMATASFAALPVNRVVVYQRSASHSQNVIADITVPKALRAAAAKPQTPQPALGASLAGAYASIPLPPPGVRVDHSIKPVANLGASLSAKEAAVLRIATGKLGTPYIWGHNEDRGQYGFDCSNFTEYVYHHALGYLMTTSSKAQYESVGVSVPISSMRVGDLLVFLQGAHVGIYAGNGQMIEEGGGLGKVGYLSVSGHSYWRQHLSAVKRLF